MINRLSVSPGPLTLLPSPQAFLRINRHPPEVVALASQYKVDGNHLRAEKQYAQAETAYAQALAVDPTYTDAWYNLADLYMELKQWQNAANCLFQLLTLTPDDVDARVKLGDVQQLAGQYWPALVSYQQVLQMNPYYDPAQRKRQLLLLDLIRVLSPQLADFLWQSQQNMIIGQAKSSLNSHYQETNQASQQIRLQEVPVTVKLFQKDGPWQSMAEYDATDDVVRVMPELMFSAPEVLAAYLAHEMVHAADKDNITSFEEEYRGYLASIEYWQGHKGMLEEPNMDLALALWQQSPEALKNKIVEVYASKGLTNNNESQPVS